MNFFRTTLLLGLMTGLFLFIGKVLGGQQGVIIAFLFAVVMNFGAYWFSDKLVLKVYSAIEVNETESPQLFAVVRQLTQKAQMPMPKVYIIESDTPNAFATGRNPAHAAVACTTGILRILNSDELEGVLAHELSHVRNRDTLTSAIAATLAGAISMLANMAMIFGGNRNEGGQSNVFSGLVMMIVAPIAAMMIQMAVSRSREYAADASGAALCGKPLALASALRKLELSNEQAPMAQAEQNPATAHLFIVNPLSGQGLRQLFSTHPSTQERINRLEEMAGRRLI